MPEILDKTGVSVRLTVPGRDLGGQFREVSGLDSETEVVEHQAVDQRGRPVIRKIPGVTRFSNITLRRGIDENRGLWEWRLEVQQAGAKGEARANGTIELLDYTGSPIAAWNFTEGWPARYGVAAGTENGGPEEIVEICVESIERV